MATPNPEESHENDTLLQHSSEQANTDPSTASLDKLILYFMSIHFLLSFTQIILVAPLLRLFENSLCLSYYDFPSGGVPESLCKIPEIQHPLATIRGWKSTLDTLPVILVAIPLGKYGDTYGRSKILALALLGIGGSLIEIFVVCGFPKIFPLELVWLSSISLLCGGGLNAASAFMWAMASESIPSDRRSHAFYYIFSAFYIAELISSFVASVTMEISPWLPCGLAMGSVITCLLLLAFTPHPPKNASRGSNAPIVVVTSASGVDSVEQDPITEAPANSTAVNGLLSALSNPQILLVVPVFLVGIFRYTTLDVLIQYASVRFGMKISTGAIFYTETAFVNILLFFFIIPQLTAHLQKRYKVRPQLMDLVLVRTSVLLMCLGCLSIGLSPSKGLLPLGVSIFAAGFGSRVSALALVSYWISDDAKATLYAAINVLESLGHAVGDPSMQQIFARSLTLPPFWQALPFFVAAGLYFLAVVSTTFVRVGGASGDDVEDEGGVAR